MIEFIVDEIQGLQLVLDFYKSPFDRYTSLTGGLYTYTYSLDIFRK